MTVCHFGGSRVKWLNGYQREIGEGGKEHRLALGKFGHKWGSERMSWLQMWMKGQRGCFLRLRSPEHISMTIKEVKYAGGRDCI